MANEIYISPTEKVVIPELKTEVATRSMASMNTLFNVLPNPDPILQKAGVFIEALRLIRRDGRVSAATRSRKAGFEKLSWKIIAKEANDNTFQFIEDAFKALDTNQIFSEILDYFGYGYQVSEVVWKKESADLLPLQVRGKPQQWFAFDDNNYLVYKPINSMPEQVKPFKFLLTTNEADYQNPYGIAIYSTCFWPVTFTRGGVLYWSKFVEKYAMPHATGKLPRSAGTKERNDFLQQLIHLVQDGVSITPDDGSVELLECQDKGGSTDTYNTFATYFNKEISVNILGHENGMTETPGKLGNNDAASDVREDIIEADKKAVTKTINTLIKWILELNPSRRGSGGVPEILFFDPDEINTELATRDKTLSETGVKFTKVYFQRNHGLAEDEFEVVETTQSEEQSFASPGKPQIELAETETGTPEDSINTIVEKAEKEFTQDVMVDQIKNMATKAKSLEELQATILNAYDELNSSDNQVTMENALLTSELAGRNDIQELV